MLNSGVLITFLVYFTIIFAIGFYASRHIKNLSDFVLGGRNLKGAVTALGVGASDMSGWLLLGLPGTFYLYGINQIWIPIGLSIGALVNWHVVAARLRIYTEKANDALTIPAFFDHRFHDHNAILRMVSAIMILVFFTVYAAAGFVGGALLFESIFPLSYEHALLLGAAAIALYTCIGGFLAVNWVDFFQGCLMFVALISVPITAFYHLDSWHSIFVRASALHINMRNAFKGVSFISILSLLTWGLGYMGQPHILSRFMAIEKVSEIPKARFICMTWMIIALFGAIFTGIIGVAYFSEHPLSDPERVFIEFALMLFNPWVAGCLLAAVLSAIMSTISAQLLASSSSLVEDFYHRFLRKQASGRELVWVSRFMVIVITAFSLLFSLNQHSRVLDLVSYGWAGLGATFSPVIIFALFWSRTNRLGAICGMIAGAITVITWQLLSNLGGIFAIYSILPGFLMGCVGVLVGSYFGKPVSQANLALHKAVSAELARSIT